MVFPVVIMPSDTMHAFKRRLSNAMTKQKTINENLDAEFVTLRSQLDGISKSLKMLSSQIRTSRQAWTQVAKQQADFSSKLTSSLPQGGMVQAHAREVEERIQSVYRRLIEEDGRGSTHERITSVLDTYQNMIDELEKEYPAIELAFTETRRYGGKVDNLNNKKKKDNVKLTRNARKKEDALKDYRLKSEDIKRRMRIVLDKHEAVFQCAHHAFWLASNTYETTIEDATEPIRLESVAVHKQLEDIDVANSTELVPIPRMKMITSGEQVQASDNLVEHNPESAIFIEHTDNHSEDSTKNDPKTDTALMIEGPPRNSDIGPDKYSETLVVPTIKPASPLPVRKSDAAWHDATPTPA